MAKKDFVLRMVGRSFFQELERIFRGNGALQHSNIQAVLTFQAHDGDQITDGSWLDVGSDRRFKLMRQAAAV
jgi:hypothetical protein